LSDAGSLGFDENGSITIPEGAIKEVLVSAAEDELRVEILDRIESDGTLVLRIREKSKKVPVLSHYQAKLLGDLSKRLKVMCDMSDLIIR